MIRWRTVKTLLGKELLEVVRDRRSLFLMIGLPLVLYPLLVLVASQVAMSQIAKVESEVGRVAITGAPLPGVLKTELEKADRRLDLRPLGRGEAREALDAGRVHAVVALPEDLVPTLAGERTASIAIHFDATSETSQRAEEEVKEALAAFGRHLVDVRLGLHGIGREVIEPLAWKSENVAPPEKVGGHLLGRVVPILIVMMVVLGAFYPAVEVTAGEKERGTLQTLLTAPVKPLEIVTGKFLVVFIVAAVSGAANILSLALLFGMALVLPDAASAAVDLGMSASTLGLMGVVAVATGLLFSALMMTVAVLARSFKEAQTYMTPVYLLCVMPAFFAQLPGVQLSGVLPFVPGVNLTLLLRQVLEGTATAQHFFAVLTSSAIYTVLVLTLAARIFERESILLGEAGLKALFTSTPRGPRRVPAPSEALALAAGVFVLLFYVGSVLQAKHLFVGLAITQWLLILVPVLAFIRWRKVDLRATLGLYRPPWRITLAATLLGATVWYPIALALRLFGGDSGAPDATEELLVSLLQGSIPTVVLVALVALSPAVCEEALFRGVLLRSFATTLKPRTAVLLTALLFGAFHMSAAKLLPTAALGVLLGLLALASGSLVPGMIFHFLHNGVSTLLVRWDVAVPGVMAPGRPVVWHAATAAAAFAVAVWLLASGRREPGRGGG